MDLEEKTIDRQTVFKGHVVDVELQHVKTPQGNTAVREIVRHAPAIALLVIDDDQKMILEKQWRAPVQNITLEIPAGKLDERDHGDARHAAVRELNEETRLKADKLTKITSFYSSVGFCDEFLTLYLAKGLKPVERALPQDQDEDIKLYRFSLEEALQMIANGEITEDEAVLGFVGAYTYAEVVSGYTSFFLGAKSVCPNATMLVEFIGSWGDPAMEATTAQDLIDKGAVIVSQHSDSTTPATTCQQNGVYHIGYNIDMSDVAPEASIISSTIDWTNYFVYVIETIVNGGTVDQDYMNHGLKDGDIKLTALNEAIAAEGTAEAIETAKKAIEDGSLHVFDTNAFTVGGETVTEAFIDMNADFQPDDTNAVFDGYYHESYFKSAPNFDLRIDGITLLNEAY